MEFCETTAVHDELEGLRVIYNEVRNKINATNGSGEKLNLIAQRDREQNEIGQTSIQLEETEKKLGKAIPNEAALFRTKPEWVKLQNNFIVTGDR